MTSCTLESVSPTPDVCGAGSFGSNLEPFAPDSVIGLEIGRRTFEHDPTVAHDMDPMGYPHGNTQPLLDK